MEAATSRELARRGLSRSAVHRATESGSLERIARGIYIPSNAEAADHDWIEASMRRPESTICLVSALSLHELIDHVPDALDVALPRGVRRPATDSAIRWHLFARDTFEVGRREIDVPGTSLRIGLYSPERCIVDAFRLRGMLGYELGRDALREWLRRGGKPAQVLELAGRIPRVHGPLLAALEVLA